MPSNIDLLIKNIMQYIDYLKNQSSITSDPKLNELLTKFRAGYNLLTTTKPQMILEYFVNYVYPHKDMIMASNESYFLDRDYTEEADGNEASLTGALRIKDMWKSKFTEENKKTTFTYFQVFIKLTERCLADHIEKFSK